MDRAIVSLGSNIEQPLLQLSLAFKAIQNTRLICVGQTSLVYRSAPIGPLDQPDFLNAAVAIDTQLTPINLMEALLDIEKRMGRKRLRRWGERSIDLDLLLYSDLQFESTELVIPHPRLKERLFVLEPLIEILGPEHCLPDGESLQEIRARCEKQTITVWCQFPKATMA